MADEIRVDGRVVKLVSDEELIINLGEQDGVRRGDLFEVLDSHAMDLTDPESGASLGQIKRTLAVVRVSQVGEQASVAELYPHRRSWTDVAAIMTGASSRPKRTLSEGWPEGVGRGDPIMKKPDVPAEATDTQQADEG